MFSQVLQHIISFVILLGILVFVHEFGHFLVAKLVGVKVLKFSIGFPPAFIRRTWGETEYTVGCIPLGGYVKLFGEDPESADEIAPEDFPRSFTAKSLWARTAVVAAGPVSNYVFALVVLCLGFLAGWPVLAAEVGKLLEGKPAMQAGMKEGDLVVGIDGKPVRNWKDMQVLIEKRAGKTVPIIVVRDGNKITLQVTPEVSKDKDPFGNHVGRIGVAPSGKEVQISPADAVREGCRFTFMLTDMVVRALVKLVKLEMPRGEIGGPILLAQGAGATWKAGVPSFLLFLCNISISLAIINLLPIPILDGGHLFFFLIEAVTGKPVIGKAREWATMAGLSIILCLMVYVFYSDIYRVWTKGWALHP